METRKLVIPILTRDGKYCNDHDDGDDECDYVVRDKIGEVWCSLFRVQLQGEIGSGYKRCFPCVHNEYVSD
ncbi:hypothetical protein FACS1894200_12910 [Spirochaetia bacterium]|nr:hypothetical protein FACS1894200_12910 [Spirochaetia bacterium]